MQAIKGRQLIKLKLASRRHFLQCKSGLLAKHFEKLIQCDKHLNAISQQSDILLRNLFYEPTFLNFWDQHELNHQFPNYVKNAYGYQVEGFLESPLSCTSVPTYEYPVEGFLESPLSYASILASFQTDLSRSSLPAQADYSLGLGIEDKESEGNFSNETMRSIDSNQEWGDEITVPRLPQSISMTDFLLESELQSSDETNMLNMPLLEAVSARQDMILNEIAHQLLSDSHMSEFDERSVMSKVDSLCSLLHREDATTSTRRIGNGDIATDNGRNYENIAKPNPAIGIHAITDGFIPMQSTGTSTTSLKDLLNQSHISRSLENLMNIPLRFP